MTEPLLALQRFRLRGEEAVDARSEFNPILESCNLSRCPSVTRVIAKYKQVAGIYFWTATVAGAEYKIYIGRTNSLSYRVFNYTAPFQPHSPNDFKLLVFRAFLTEIAPDSLLHLCFREVPFQDLKSEEKSAIAKYRPLLNQSRVTSAEARAQLQAAFAQFYRASFEGVMSNES